MLPAQPLQFADYPVKEVYQGKVVLPSFSGRDRHWRNYRTRIAKSMTADGVRHAGEINVAQIGCGTGCSFLFLANVRTGKVYDFPRHGERDRFLQVYTEPASKLMAAQWQGADGCHLEYYVWTGNGVRRLRDSIQEPIQRCNELIRDNLP